MTGVLYTAQGINIVVSTVKVIVSSKKLIKVVNFKFGG